MNLNKSEIHILLLLFAVAAIVRMIPELVAFPYPIGYDVINYYIPVITNFEDKWNVVSGQFPLYVLMLHYTRVITSLNPEIIVRIFAILIFGFFSIAVYEIGKRSFHLGYIHSAYIGLFVIFQLSVLRTSWDLHKDMLSLTAMLFAISFTASYNEISRKTFIFVSIMSVIAVTGDRMIGLLLTTSLIINAIVIRKKKHLILAAMTSFVFLLFLLHSNDEISQNIPFLGNAQVQNRNYDPLNLVVLLLITTGFVAPLGIIGLFNTHQLILKIPLLLSLFGSFLWIISPNSSSFLPDRWTYVFSILLSIYAGYGLIVLVDKIFILSRKKHNIILIGTVTVFAIMGVLFAVTNYNYSISLFAPFHRMVGQFGPVTMQYNSISIPESKSIIAALEWINYNTPTGSIIIIDKHWRGWTEVKLNERKFQFYEKGLEGTKNGKYYLLKLDNRLVPNFKINKTQPVYSNDHFSLYNLTTNNSY